MKKAPAEAGAKFNREVASVPGRNRLSVAKTPFTSLRGIRPVY